MRHALIVSPSRSGSTSLRIALNRVNGVAFHGELSGPNKILGKSHKMSNVPITLDERINNPKTAVDKLLLDRQFTLTGFKALYKHFYLNKSYVFIEEYLKLTPDVIFIWRKNLVARYLSQCRLRLDAGYLNLDKFLSITPEQIIKDAKSQVTMATEIIGDLKNHGCSIYGVTFEDLIFEESTVKGIFDFLALPMASQKLEKDARSKKNEGRTNPSPTPESFMADHPDINPFRDMSLNCDIFLRK